MEELLKKMFPDGPTEVKLEQNIRPVKDPDPPKQPRSPSDVMPLYFSDAPNFVSKDKAMRIANEFLKTLRDSPYKYFRIRIDLDTINAWSAEETD